MRKRKLLALDDEVWAMVADYRFGNRIDTESEALRRLVEAGLEAQGLAVPKQPTKRGRRS